MVGPPSQVKLRITRDRQTIRVIDLESDVILLGRDPSCDLHLDDRKVSRRHCEIRVEADRIAVFDLDSQNGCYVGKRTGIPSPTVTDDIGR